jgi:hypothetical protein
VKAKRWPRQTVVGRGGLEPPTSAVIGPERCASRVETPSVRRGVIRPGQRCSASRPSRGDWAFRRVDQLKTDKSLGVRERVADKTSN